MRWVTHLPKGESSEDGFSDSLLLRPVEVREGAHQLSCLLPPPFSLCWPVGKKFAHYQSQQYLVTTVVT